MTETLPREDTAVTDELRMFLFENEQDEFLGSLYRQLNRKGKLSESQVAAARRSQERQAEWQARRDAEREALKDAPPLVEGRREVEGELLSAKWKESNYGGGFKMLVREDDGNKVWGTLPESLLTWDPETGSKLPEAGTRVAFTAEVERSDDDPHFGFFKRPKNARFVEEAASPVEAAEAQEYVEEHDEPLTIEALARQYADTKGET